MERSSYEELLNKIDELEFENDELNERIKFLEGVIKNAIYELQGVV